MWVADFVVKNRVHAAGKQTFLPLLATFKLRCYLWVLSLIVASWGAHTQFTFQKYPHWGSPLTPSE
jgi:hypothetical protein